MMKLQTNQVVWARHPRNNIEWPAKIVHFLRKKQDLEVVFYNSASSDKDTAIVGRNACKHFDSIILNEKESPLELYEAYNLARKELAKSRLIKMEPDTPENKFTQKDQCESFELKKFLEGLLTEIPTGKLLEEKLEILDKLQLKQRDIKVYFRESFCEKLLYVINQRSTDKGLNQSLKNVLQKITFMILEAFSIGNL